MNVTGMKASHQLHILTCFCCDKVPNLKLNFTIAYRIVGNRR